MYIELDTKLVKELEKITMEDFTDKIEKSDQTLIKVEEIENTFNNLLNELDKKQEIIDDNEEDLKMFYKPKTQEEYLNGI